MVYPEVRKKKRGNYRELLSGLAEGKYQGKIDPGSLFPEQLLALQISPLASIEVQEFLAVAVKMKREKLKRLSEVRPEKSRLKLQLDFLQDAYRLVAHY